MRGEDCRESLCKNGVFFAENVAIRAKTNNSRNAHAKKRTVSSSILGSKLSSRMRKRFGTQTDKEHSWS